MTNQLTLYANELKRLLDLLIEANEGLDEAQLNWRPAGADVNSCYVIATHVLGNLEAWVLGIVCGQSVERDRPAEFRAAGSDTSTLAARARDLATQFEQALERLPAAALGETRDSPHALWGLGTPEPRTGREALMETIEHAAIHVGELQLTRDLALAATGVD